MQEWLGSILGARGNVLGGHSPEGGPTRFSERAGNGDSKRSCQALFVQLHVHSVVARERSCVKLWNFRLGWTQNVEIAARE